MKILALEAYYGGSHKAFLDGWIDNSRHEWTLLTLPPNKWKWRMRNGAVAFADQVNEMARNGQSWDVIFCSDMLNLAEFLGLVDKSVRDLTSMVYFHENQLTYPNRFESERDYQYVMTNLTTCLAADYVWFNSDFHRGEFLDAMKVFLKRMPEPDPIDPIERIMPKSAIYPPGIERIDTSAREQDRSGPLNILWAGRWEHDKNPEDFFAALKIVKDSGVDFRLNVIGESFREAPDVFELAKKEFADHIDRWGYQENREDYEATLLKADVIVSTANHEFFGITVVEAISAGTWPLLPDRLAYPEIIRYIGPHEKDEFFYDGTVKGLADKLIKLAELTAKGPLWPDNPNRGIWSMKLLHWPTRARIMDNDIEDITGKDTK